MCLTEYDPGDTRLVAYPKEFPADVLADVLAEASLARSVPHRRDREVLPHADVLPEQGAREPKAGEERALPSPHPCCCHHLRSETQMSEPDAPRHAG